ncbi:MAG: efflux RND transporter periplasmic adaptor subunit [Bacteroidia bacterium]|nr:efflux RND transporter periplasmic adaptor subunit [Bacteroidia bacterium]MBP9688390.1 efflux RND transporter periplasmic adaptor subunit [Bacteroidia bacterium]
MSKIQNQKKKSNRLLLVLAIIVVVLIVILVIGKKQGWVGQSDIVKVSTSKAETTTITESVTANGKIQPEVEVKISSDVSGEIRELYVREGDSVKVGQLLARIDPELYESALARTEAALNNSRANLASSKARLLQAEAKLTELEKQFKRNTQLHKEQLLSDAEFETAKSTYLTAKAEVEASKQTILAAQYTVQSQEASLKESTKNLSRTEIFAPVNGVVSKLSVEKGERVVGTSQMAGTEMMRVANLNNMEVSVDVNENDIVKVSLGDTTMVEVDAYGTRKFKGIVTEIANSATTTTATTSDQVTNFVVKIRILRASYADLTEKYGSKRSVFRPGMSASVDIQTQSVNNVVGIPIEAVTMRSLSELDSTKVAGKYTSKSTTTKITDEVEMVFVFNDNKVMLRQVKTGIQNDKLIEIKEGLQLGDEVVSAPFSAITRTLKNNTLVKKVAKQDLFESK